MNNISKQYDFYSNLEEAKNKYECLINCLPIGVCLCDIKGDILDVNDSFFEMLGYCNRGQFLSTIVNLFDVVLFYKRGDENYFERRLFEKHYYQTFKSRENKPVIVKESILEFEEKGKKYFLVTALDVTEHFLSKNELRLNKYLLSEINYFINQPSINCISRMNIFEKAAVIFQSLGVDNMVSYEGNSKSPDKINYFGKNVEIKDNLSKFRDFFTAYMSLIRNIDNGEIIFAATGDLPSEDQKILLCMNIHAFIILPLFQDQKIECILGLFKSGREKEWTPTEKEIVKLIRSFLESELKRMEFEERLIAEKEKAEKAISIKDEFLAQISHEIRTPLNVVVSFISYLKEEFNSLHKNEAEIIFSSMTNASNRIIRTVEMILNMAELKNGLVNVEIEQVDIYNDVLLKLVKEFAYYAKQKDIQLNIEANSKINTCFSDPDKLETIFTHLIDNAIKYTEKGEINIHLSHLTNSELCVEIIDTGIGIDDEFLSDLFTPFSQESQGYTRKFDGVGLGLAVTKNYCDLIGATISIQSKKNIGTKVVVVIPVNSNCNISL